MSEIVPPLEQWGYRLTSEWRESGRPGYVLASVRHNRGGMQP